MSNIASINFKKTKTDFQVWHNDRTLAPEYLISQKNIELNRTGLEANALRDKIIANAQSAYFKRLKQRCQAKNYLWSAALNIKETTTMSELENLAKHFKDKYGIQCYQIAIHKDEGHKDEKGEIKLNNHAHMEFVTLDERGINRQRDFGKFVNGKKIICIIQDDVANILKMKRGVSVKKSKVKRVEPRVWAKIKEEEAKREKKLKDHLKEILKNEKSAMKTRILEFQNKIAVLNEQNLEFQNQIVTLNKQNLEFQNQIKALNEAQSKTPSNEEIKKKIIKGQNAMLNFLINKLEDISKSDDEIQRFMSIRVNGHQLIARLFDAFKDIIRAHIKNEQNEVNRLRQALNDASNQIAILTSDIARHKEQKVIKQTKIKL